MFCTKCGDKIPMLSKFCTKCGHKVTGAEESASKGEPPRHKTLKMIGVLVASFALVFGTPFIIYLCVHKTIVWDGTYTAKGTLECEGNIPNLTSMPIDSTTTVIGNQLVEQLQGKTMNFAIDKDGKAIEILEPTVISGITAGGTTIYQFYQEDGVNKYTATTVSDISVTKSGKTYSSTCTGTVEGVKQ